MLNKISFIGHLGKDPETRYMQSGDPVTNFSVASTEKWKGRDGAKNERTEWLNCVTFGRLAEVCGEWLKKGSLVYVEGKLQTDKYDDKDGITRYATKCVVREMKMLGTKAPQADKPQGKQQEPDDFRGSQPPADDFDDDIPF